MLICDILLYADFVAGMKFYNQYFLPKSRIYILFWKDYFRLVKRLVIKISFKFLIIVYKFQKTK